VSFVSGEPPAIAASAFRADVRIRHRATPIPASVRPATANEPNGAGSWIVETDAPVWAAAPGQAAVLYDGDVVIGGGRIERISASAVA
jgi:tRNA-uridine 2-sulfurtransferase